MNQNDLEKRFSHHQATNARAAIHDELRRECLMLAEYLSDTVPAGRELALALTKLEEVMFWGNAGIARSDVN